MLLLYQYPYEVTERKKEMKNNDIRQFMRQAAAVKPSARQLDWFDKAFYAFIHFGINTFTDSEWGKGDEPETLFAPRQLDCEQWVAAIKSAGMKGMILTAKHHDGFCLWPSKYTQHSVKNASIKRDVVGEAADACRKGGIAFGFYLSPWDRNSGLYGTEAYNDYFCNQLTELLTEYGDIFCVWFDNACGEGADGKKQIYDFPRYIELVRKYQPGAVIFNDYGPDVRWCGNEAGRARYAEWAVVPAELCHYGKIQTGEGPMAQEGNLSFLYNTCENLGSLDNILYSKGLTFTPAEIDMSIRPGWFWHEHEEPHSLERLFHTYLDSVGGNCCLNLNVPPDRNGKIDERDVRRLHELGQLIEKELGNVLLSHIEQTPSGSPTQPGYVIDLKQENPDIRYVVLQEDITRGQRVESFQILGETEDGNHYPFYQGTTIGNRKICQLVSPFAEQHPLIPNIQGKLRKLIVQITSARDEVFMKNIEIF